MKSHATIGAACPLHIRPWRRAIPGIKHHHEFWDGSRYPARLAGEAIPLAGRILLIGRRPRTLPSPIASTARPCPWPAP